MAEQLLPQPQSHDDTMHKKCYLLPHQNFPIRADETVDIPMQTLRVRFSTRTSLATTDLHKDISDG